MNAVPAAALRRAVPADLNSMVELGFRLCDKTPYAHIERDRPSIVKTFCASMSSQFGCAFVTEHEGILTGLIIGQAEQLWWSRKRYATDLMFYAERPGAGYRLLKRFVEWAWQVPGVVEITMGQSSGLDAQRSGTLYLRAGLSRVGGVYAMVKPEEQQLCRAS